MTRRLIMLLISIFCLVFIVGLVRSIFSLWSKGEIVGDLARQEKQKQTENDGLKRQLTEVQSSGFVERQARDKLNLQKPGEMVVVLPQNIEQEIGADASTSGENTRKPSNFAAWVGRIF